MDGEYRSPEPGTRRQTAAPVSSRRRVSISQLANCWELGQEVTAAVVSVKTRSNVFLLKCHGASSPLVLTRPSLRCWPRFRSLRGGETLELLRFGAETSAGIRTPGSGGKRFKRHVTELSSTQFVWSDLDRRSDSAPGAAAARSPEHPHSCGPPLPPGPGECSRWVRFS